MQAAPHRIRRQRWRVRARSQREALAVRQQLREQLDGPIPRLLEAAFDAVAPGDEVVYLSRLEIRVRVADVGDLVERLPALIRLELHDRLDERLGARRSGGAAGPGAAAPDAGAIRRAPAGQRRVEALARYLETGTLPWSSASWDPETRWLRSAPVAELAAAAALVAPRAWTWAVSFRLLQLVPEGEWGSFARAIAATIARGTLAAAPDGEGALAAAGAAPSPAASAADELVFLLAAIGAAVAPARHAKLALAAVVVAALGAGSEDRARAAVREIPGDVVGRARAALDAHPSLPAGLHQRLIGLVGTVAPDTARSEPDAAQPLDRARPAAVGNATAAGTAGPVRAPLSSARAGDAPAAQPFGALVDAAGLIIVHPFIERFFDNSGIARPRPSELRAAELPRAAALLHLLATGEDEAPENELGFIKILLGLDLETPLPIAAGLVDAGDRGQAESLLGAVVAHWGALGNTSADGLRASFLRRCGLIREDENGYRLRVEPAPYDMLLRKLPWGTGLIKLPWMRRPIFTEWEPA